VWINVLKPKITHATLTGEPQYEIVVVRRKRVLVHRLVAAAFHGERPPEKIVHHRDHNKRNNMPDNLQYVTRSDNTRLAYADGRIGRTHKLNAFSRSKLVQCYEQGDLVDAIAKQFGVHRSTVLQCVHKAGIVPDRNRRRLDDGGRVGRKPYRRDPNHPQERSTEVTK
jgi:hypothetical protein